MISFRCCMEREMMADELLGMMSVFEVGGGAPPIPRVRLVAEGDRKRIGSGIAKYFFVMSIFNNN